MTRAIYTFMLHNTSFVKEKKKKKATLPLIGFHPVTRFLPVPSSHPGTSLDYVSREQRDWTTKRRARRCRKRSLKAGGRDVQ
jgi:hypothetical protein